LATIGKNGFSLLKNVPLSTFIQTGYSNIIKGLKIAPESLLTLNGGNSIVSEGLISILYKKKNN
jgi:hypothetical protein